MFFLPRSLTWVLDYEVISWVILWMLYVNYLPSSRTWIKPWFLIVVHVALLFLSLCCGFCFGLYSDHTIYGLFVISNILWHHTTYFLGETLYYGGCIYNYLFNQCRSPLMFESRSGRGVQNYVIKFVSDLRQIGGFLRVLRFPPPIKLTATI